MTENEITRFFPRTVDAAVDRVLEILPVEARGPLRDAEGDELVAFHDGLGAPVRDELGAWSGSAELIADCGTARADDCSMAILAAASARLRAPVIAADVPANRTACALAVSASHVAVGHSTGDVDLFDAATGKRLWKERPADGPRGTAIVVGLSFSPDGHLLALSNAGKVTVLDVDGGDTAWQQPFAVSEAAHGVRLSWSADGQWLVWGDGEGVSRLKVGDWKRTRLKLPFARGNGAVSLSRDGRLLAYRCNNDTPAVRAHPTMTYVVDLASRRLFAPVDAPPVPGGLRAIHPRFSAVHDDVLWLGHSKIGYLRYDLSTRQFDEGVPVGRLEAQGFHEPDLPGQWAAQADVAVFAARAATRPGSGGASGFFGVVSPASGFVRRVEGSGPVALSADGRVLYRVVDDGRPMCRGVAVDA
jgi:hypothetical protein